MYPLRCIVYSQRSSTEHTREGMEWTGCIHVGWERPVVPEALEALGKRLSIRRSPDRQPWSLERDERELKLISGGFLMG